MFLEPIVRRILLVEDEALIAMTEKMQLEKYGYAVRTVTTGENAIDAVESYSDIDLILMDINLGEGIDGTQAAEIILKDHDIPVVFLSSHTEPEVVEKTEKITSYGYVVKSSSITVLDASIKMAFRLFDANKKLKNELVGRKQAEEKIQELDVRMRKLFANVPDLVYQFSRRPDGSYYVPIASNGVRNIFGCTPEDIRESFEPISKVIYPEDAARVIEDIEYSAKHLTYFTCEFRVHIPGRDIQWILSRSTPERLPDGSITWYGFNADITERKRAEEAMREQRDFSESLIETAQAIILVLDTQGRIVRFNPYTEELLGYSLDEVKGMDWLETFVPAENGPAVKSVLQQAVTGTHTRGNVNSIVAKDGRMILVEWYNKTLKDADGHALGVLATGIDITERKQAETKLAESVKLLSRAQEIARIGHWRLDLTVNLLSWSDEVYRIFGCKPQEFAATYEAFLDFVHPDDRAAVDDAYSRSLREANDGYEIEHRIVRRDSEDIRYVRERCDHERDDTGTVIQSIGMVQDITEQKRNQQELSERNALLNDVMENMLDLVAITDLDGSFFYVGRSHERLGYSVASLKGRNVMDFVHPDDLDYVTRELSAFVQGENDASVEYRYRCADGSYVWLETTGRLLKNENGIPFRILFNTRDVTGRKQWEDVLENERRRLSAIIDGTDVGTWEWNVQTGETRVNKRWASIIGYTLEEISPVSFETWQGFTHAEDLARSEQLLRAHFSGDTETYDIEVRMRHKNGHWVWVLDRGKVATWTADGKPEWVFGTHQEINARKRQEEKRFALADAASTLQASSCETIDYTDIAETAKQLSGATFAALNIFGSGQQNFTTRAIAGLPEHIQRASKLLGFPIVGRTWNYDPHREAALGESRTTVFPSLGSLASGSFSVSIADRIAGAFHVGEVVIVRIATPADIQGDFTLFFSTGDHFQDKDLVETYSSMVGITLERIRTEQHNAKLVADKETLLREVHHRIKNNMNTMTSLLALHANTVENPTARSAIRDAESRMRSMQTLYDQLNLSDNQNRGSLVSYLRTLAPQVVNLFPAGKEVTVSVTSSAAGSDEVSDDECTMDAKRLSTVGLIVNELLTNTMKYAFPSTVSSHEARTAPPAVNVAVDCADGDITVVVEDNGVGLPTSFDRKESSGFGLMMVTAMVGQLEGTLRYESGRTKASQGTRAVLRFPSDPRRVDPLR